MPSVLALKDLDNVEKLVEGQLDFWATTDVVAAYFAKQQGFAGFKVAFVWQDVDLYLALNINTPANVVKRLQAALDAMIQNGEVDKIKAAFY